MEITSDNDLRESIIKIAGVNDKGEYVRETLIVPSDGTPVYTNHSYISIGFDDSCDDRQNVVPTFNIRVDIQNVDTVSPLETKLDRIYSVYSLACLRIL